MNQLTALPIFRPARKAERHELIQWLRDTYNITAETPWELLRGDRPGRWVRLRELAERAEEELHAFVSPTSMGRALRHVLGTPGGFDLRRHTRQGQEWFVPAE